MEYLIKIKATSLDDAIEKLKSLDIDIDNMKAGEKAFGPGTEIYCDKDSENFTTVEQIEIS